MCTQLTGADSSKSTNNKCGGAGKRSVAECSSASKCSGNSVKKLVLKPIQSPAAKPQYRINYAGELNAAQYEAVIHRDGAALVIAGAGTGKTRTLIYRVARLVEDGVAPMSILLLTFTRKASAEMIRRASILLDGRCQDVSGGTFHSFAHQSLRRYARIAGFDQNFSVLDQSDAEDVVNLLRGNLINTASAKRFPRKQTLFSIYSAAVNRVKHIDEIVAEEYPQYENDTEDIVKIYHAYEHYKRRHNLMDYDDLLLHFLTVCRESSDVRKHFHSVYRHVLVDEYQDTNSLQHEIVLCMAGPDENVVAVGDDAQSIYSFRGANFQNIMNFPASFRKCALIKLEENYRSTQPILNLTNELIRRAAFGYEKELYTHKTGGDTPAVICADSEQMQSKFIVQQVLELREQGVALEDMAVLFRSGFHSFDVEIELNRANIPYQKFGGFKFVETAHVKDIIAHLRVLLNPRDAVSWNRILLLLDGIGPRTAASVIDGIVEGRLSLHKTTDLAITGQKGEQIMALFDLLRGILPEHIAVDEKVAQIVEHYRPLMRRKYDDYSKRAKDVDVFVDIAERYHSLHALLSDMALEAPVESVADVDKSDKEEEFLTLSTIHSAKGLEWTAVFVIWALDGRFPPVRAFDTLDALEEERRLMYVACTRAREHLFITYPMNIYDRESGMVLGKPSRFIEGLSEGLADHFMLVDE